MQKRSGVSRKLDEVGRIVIPKEIRSYLALREGSKLEIAINDIGEVILRKQGCGTDDNANQLGAALNKYIDMDVIYIIDGMVEANWGTDVMGGKASASVQNVVAKGVTYFACQSDKTTIMPTILGAENDAKSQIICPIKMSGEWVGAIICLSAKPIVDVWQVKVVEFVASVIGG